MAKTPKSNESSFVGTIPQVGGVSPFQMDRKHKLQVLTPSSDYSVRLPSNAAKGESFEISTTLTAFTVTVQSSNGNNIRFLRNTAKIVLVALIDAPTLPADWHEHEYKEQGQFSLTDFAWTAGVAPATLQQNYGFYTRDKGKTELSGFLRYQTVGTTVTRLIAKVPVWLNPIGSSTNYSGLVNWGWLNSDSGAINTNVVAGSLERSGTGTIIFDIGSTSVKSIVYSASFESNII